MSSTASYRDVSPSKRRWRHLKRSITLQTLPLPTKITSEAQNVPLSPTEPVSPSQTTVNNKTLRIVQGPTKGRPVRRCTTFMTMIATKTGIQEHTLDLDVTKGRRCGEILMDQFKAIVDPKKPWDSDD